jgi:hypothetical protein
MQFSRQFKGTDMRSRDPSDPIYHDIKGDAAEPAFVNRHNKWAAKQPAAHQRYFCEHGYYVGHNEVFAKSCPGCAAKGEK